MNSAAGVPTTAIPARGKAGALAAPSTAEVKAQPESAVIPHTPAFIGDDGLNTRSMCRKRSGRPRWLISSGPLAAIARVEMA